MCNDKKDNDKRYMGFELKKLNTFFKRAMFAAMAKEGLDEIAIMHGYVLGYLYNNQDKDIFQKDLENHFAITKSNVTAIIKSLESKGYVTRAFVESDARLKKLTLTEEGIKIHNKTVCIIDRLHEQSEEGITEEEKELFYKIVNKMKNNIKKDKEERDA